MSTMRSVLLGCTLASLGVAMAAYAQNAPGAGRGDPAAAAAPGGRGAAPGGAAPGAAGGRGARGGGGGGVTSPVVNADRTVTFRVRAPQASAVELTGEVTQGKGALPMTKGADGNWSITVGPMPPEIWIYNFRVEGVDFPDPTNISIMPRSPTSSVASFVEVPGDTPAFYDPRPVPHGQVRMLLYESKAMGVDRYVWVYTPPNYDKSTEKYPVFYLLHGNGENQEGWVTSGRANIILDNLIADGKAVPMILVMTHGHAIQSARVGPPATVPPPAGGGGGGGLNYALFTKEMLEQVIPTIEENFRVVADADHRAIGGLSMGAAQSVSIGLSNPNVFHNVLAYSGGFGGMGRGGAGGSVETQAPWSELLANPTETNKRLKLLFLGCGQQETAMLAPGQQLVKALKEKGINAHWADYPGGHVFSVWRNDLHDTAQMLFK